MAWQVRIVASLVFAIVLASTVSAQRGGAPAGGGRQSGAAAGGGQRGADPLGSVAALGQEVRRKPAPTGPVPHLPDGTVDLSGLWVGGGPVQDIGREGGLKPGTLESLMTPAAKSIFASRKEVDNPQFHCLPMGIPRTTPYPF